MEYVFSVPLKSTSTSVDELKSQGKPTANWQRLSLSLRQVAWPMTQAGLSTVLAVAPLQLVDSYMSKIFVKSVFLVVLLGLIHGLFILPTAFSMDFGPFLRFIKNNFFYRRVQGSNTSGHRVSGTNGAVDRNDVRQKETETPVHGNARIIGYNLRNLRPLNEG